MVVMMSQFAIEAVRRYSYLPGERIMAILSMDGDTVVYNEYFAVRLRNQLPEAYDFSASDNKIMVSSDTHTIIVSLDTAFNPAQFTVHQSDYLITLPLYRFEEVIYCMVDNTEKEIHLELNTDFSVKRVLDFPMGMNGIRQLVSKDAFISRTSKVITLCSLIDGTEIWRLETAQLLGADDPTAVHEFIVLDDKLYFYLYDSNKIDFQATFCLDVKTGAVLKRFDGFGGRLQLYNNKIYTALRNKVSVLDLAREEIETMEFEQELAATKFYINAQRWVVENEYLYFVDGMGMPKDRLGILNMETGKIVWDQKIDTTDTISNCIDKISVCNGKLFAHASDKTLHIFEK